MLGNIVYLYVCDLTDILSVKQELNKNRFAKITKETPIKGGKNGEQYIQYEATSLVTGKIFSLNNYLSSYNYVSINELENTLKFLEPIVKDIKLKEMYNMIEEIKEMDK